MMKSTLVGSNSERGILFLIIFMVCKRIAMEVSFNLSITNGYVCLCREMLFNAADLTSLISRKEIIREQFRY